jgi:hypothetical protein
MSGGEVIIISLKKLLNPQYQTIHHRHRHTIREREDRREEAIQADGGVRGEDGEGEGATIMHTMQMIAKRDLGLCRCKRRNKNNRKTWGRTHKMMTYHPHKNPKQALHTGPVVPCSTPKIFFWGGARREKR